MSYDGYKETKIGLVPDNWNATPIGDFAFVRRGASPRPIGDSKYFSESGRGWIRIADVTASKKRLQRTKQYLSDLGANKSVPVNPGDLIMSICATIGKPIILDMEACIHDGFVLFSKFRNRITTEYLYYELQRLEHSFISLGQEGTQKNLNTNLVRKTIIPLPPLPEQKKIATILSTVDEAIEKSDRIIEETKQLKKGLMRKLFLNKAYMIMSKAKEESTHLKPMRLSELGDIITGSTPRTNIKEYYNPWQFMFIGPADLGSKNKITTSIKNISKKGFKVARQLSANSVMTVCIGATIGKVGITSEPCATNQQINTIIPTENISAQYIYYLISGITQYLLSFAGDTATPILNKGEFGKVITFIHENINERHEIVCILSEVDAKIEKEQTTKDQLVQLKKGLMQVLLTGQVRVNV